MLYLRWLMAAIVVAVAVHFAVIVVEDMRMRKNFEVVCTDGRPAKTWLDLLSGRRYYECD